MRRNMIHQSLLGTALTVGALMLTACGGGSAAQTPAADLAPIAGISDELVTAARQEGSVTIYAGGHSRDQIELLKSMFEARYGITVTYRRDDTSATVNAIEAEKASGTINADVVSLADPIRMQQWADEKLITAADPINQDRLIDGIHQDGTPQVPFVQVPLGIMYNTANTQESELPATWADVTALAPKSVITADPNASGTALSFYVTVSAALGSDWIGQLQSAQPIVTESTLGLSQMVLTGETTFGIPANETTVLAAAKGGEPLAIHYPSDGVPIAFWEVASIADAPHPNAGRLLVDYQLSDEFQQALVDASNRSVLQGMPAPEGAPDLSGVEQLPVSVEDLAADGADVRAEFAAKIGA
ncbi:extracellular solute-binding protein [Nakamurella sp. YIM 132087]|uniref:Extracellular solute-binding protein n=1 Tax=Nakamurella alba TaxID=2665158 RepID=A0A7K1FDY6_9ACTN|nr:extracellular solute-binding protein [Nakamurella alba]MTD12332.1 extracellular solute-binding protein [Nakamurella alba]